MSYTKAQMTPVRRGKIYCAYFCGSGCTWAEYQKAKRDGAALAKRLGVGWTVRVWENLGWHWEARSPCERWSVRMESHGTTDKYRAALCASGEDGALWHASGRTLKAVLQAVWGAAQKDIALYRSFENAGKAVGL